VARSYFGTDGVRGIVGEFLTAELVEQLGKASALWSGRGRVFVGRDTRASGEELEEAFARGVASAGGSAVLAGVIPTPAAALLRLDLGVIITASHNPPEYNGVKFFDHEGRKLSDAAEEEIEALLDAPAPGGGEIAHVGVAVDSYLDHVLERFSSDLRGLRIAVDCANGSYASIAPRAFTELGAHVEAIGNEPDGNNINVGCGATDLSALQRVVTAGDFDLGIAFDGDGDRMLAVDENGAALDGDQIVAILALALGVDLVAVTTMTNLGFHRLMEEHGVRVITTDVGDRYVLDALYREGGILGGEQSGHIIFLDHATTGDGMVAALMVLAAMVREGKPLSELAAAMTRYPQVLLNFAVARKRPFEEMPAVLRLIEQVERDLGADGRVVVRYSGTESKARVMIEGTDEAGIRAQADEIAQKLQEALSA
jgi:phosphoglucosamine mutase